MGDRNMRVKENSSHEVLSSECLIVSSWNIEPNYKFDNTWYEPGNSVKQFVCYFNNIFYSSLHSLIKWLENYNPKNFWSKKYSVPRC